MYVNIIRSSVRDVVAICDDELLGKIFEEGKAQLNVKENFYAGERKDREEVLKIASFMKKEDATFNVVGDESIGVFVELGILKEGAFGVVDGVKFSLVLI